MSKLNTILALSAMLGGGNFFGGPRYHKQGDCEVCGKKNVRAGWEKGIYLCGKHLQERESKEKELKGAKNGICNRGACNNSHAIHYNRSTLKWYCTPCARKINASCPADWEPLCSWPKPEDMGEDHLLK